MADPIKLQPSEARQGWKEIADYFGVTTRTVQLWERERGLPVRRLPGGRVYAVDEELKEWAKNGPAAETESAPPKRRPHWAWALLLIPLCAALSWPWWRPVYPAAATVAGNTLTVANDGGKELWRVTLPAPLSILSSVNQGASSVRLFDIDGDGHNEVLAAVQARDRQGPDELLCYSSRGRLRWSWRSGGKVRTVDQDLSGKYCISYVEPWVSASSRGVLVNAVSMWSFASQVVLLDADGRKRRQYWHSGHLRSMLVVDSDRDGRSELWTGGVHNPSGRAVVVVLDPEQMQGASVEEKPRYQILGQGPPREVARVLLYRTEPSRAAAPFNAVNSVTLNDDRIAIGVQETFPGVGINFPALMYEFEGKGELVSSLIVDNSRLAYSEMEARHQIAAGGMERDRAHLREITWLKRWGRD